MNRLRFAVEQLREWLAEKLIERALRTFPTFNSVREGIMRGMREQRDYDRYAAYAKILGEMPLPFDRWREEWGWLGTKFKNRTAAAEA